MEAKSRSWSTTLKLISAFADSLRLRLAPAIDAEVARCEFECRRLDCTIKRYEKCQLRLAVNDQIRQYSPATDC